MNRRTQHTCRQCGRILYSDECALHKKLFGKMSTSFLCLDCISSVLSVEPALLEKKIEDFKAMGCTLFD